MAPPASAIFRRPSGAPSPQPLRLRLFMLVASGLLPLAIAAVLAAAYLVNDNRAQAHRAALEVSRALGTAVDSELQAAIGVLQSLGLSEDLAALKLSQFHDQARRIAQQRGWRTILLADPEGNQVLSSNRPLGEPLSVYIDPVDPQSLQRSLTTAEPVIGKVVEGWLQPGTTFAVHVPIVRDGHLAHVLTAVLSTDQIQNVLTRQRVPQGWAVGIVDQHGVRVASTRLDGTMRLSPSAQALMDAGLPEGTGMARTPEGVASLIGYSRLGGSGWVVAVAIATSDVFRAVLPLLLAMLGGILASLLLSAYLAWVFTRRISEPIDTLKNAAAALGRGDHVDLPELGIAELEEVGAALRRAAAGRAAAQEERMRSEAERESLLARMAEALRLAEEAGRGKDEFLAVLGHELRNPLAPIATALHLMERKGDERTRAERDIVQRQLGYMVRLVDDLLDVSRITSKRLAIRLEPLRLAALVGPLVEAAGSLMVGRSLQVQVTPEAASSWVRGDEVRLAQVLNNLLGNAVKFTSQAGHIVLSATRDGPELVIEVRDDGLGMPPAVLERAFEPFFQAPQDMDRARGGLGLGLAIVRSLVEMHGGSVSAASPGEGRGTTITVRLPCIDEPAAATPDAPAESAPAMGRVLVVDDNQDAADTIGTLLELSGYEVKVVYDPASAMETMASFRPDAAVLDIGLPGMSGHDLARILRAAPYHFTGKLLALTGYGQQSDVDRAMRSGFDAHLTKPVMPQALLDALAGVVTATERA